MGVFSIILTFSQVGINTTEPHESSVLHLNSSDKGFLLPYFNITDLNLKSPVISPTIAEGLLAYNTNTTTGKGIYYWDGTKWSGLGQVNFTNIYNSVIKPLNAVLNDMDTFPYLINAMVAPPSPGLRRFDYDYSAPGDDIIINKSENIQKQIRIWVNYQLEDDRNYNEHSNYYEIHDLKIIDVDTDILEYSITNVSEDYISVELKISINYQVEIIIDDEESMYKDDDTKEWLFYDTKPVLIDEVRYIDVDLIFDIDADDDTVYEPEIELINQGRDLNI